MSLPFSPFNLSLTVNSVRIVMTVCAIGSGTVDKLSFSVLMITISSVWSEATSMYRSPISIPWNRSFNLSMLLAEGFNRYLLNLGTDSDCLFPDCSETVH